MSEQIVNKKHSLEFTVRTLTKSKSSGTRYLNVTNLLPSGWTHVKVTVELLDKEAYLLKVEPIK